MSNDSHDLSTGLVDDTVSSFWQVFQSSTQQSEDHSGRN